MVIVLSAVPEAWSLALAQPRSGRPNPDWPCRQILVGRISLAAVWSGPPIEGVAWHDDRATADLVAKIAARRTPLEDAEHLIDEFAKAHESDKKQKLVALFAGLFETLNDERTQIIEGLLRFGAKQRELAAKIRTKKGLQGNVAPGESPDAAAQGVDSSALEWDLRIFEERRQSIAYVCDTPTLIEQRLFALARIIQRYLE